MATAIFISGGPGTTAVPHNFVWNANENVPAFPAQPGGGFDGLLQNNAALIGPGPFDGQRGVEHPATISALRVSQRAPSTAASTTTVEFYRIRGAYPGTVESLGLVSLDNTQQFQVGTAAPTVSDLAPNDLLFVAFSAVPTLGATDVTCWLELA